MPLSTPPVAPVQLGHQERNARSAVTIARLAAQERASEMMLKRLLILSTLFAFVVFTMIAVITGLCISNSVRLAELHEALKKVFEQSKIGQPACALDH